MLTNPKKIRALLAVVVAAWTLAGAAFGLLLPLAPEVGVLLGGEGLRPSRVATLLDALVLVEAAVALLA